MEQPADDPTVTLDLNGGTARRAVIHLSTLTPRARAIAEILASGRLGTRCPIIIESVNTIREMGATEKDLTFYSADQLDKPHRTVWEHWARYPSNSTQDPHEYLEQHAAKMPIGYYPVGLGVSDRAPSADAARDDADLIGKPQVLELLHALGRPISPTTMDNYRSRPPAGWPQPARYVGRTPQWSRAAIEAYAAAGGVE